MKKSEILRFILLSAILFCIIFSIAACGTPSDKDDDGKIDGDSVIVPKDFSFALVFGTYGQSAYDSESGKLVKTTNATNPDDYVTELFLSEESLKAIFETLSALDISSYPEKYDPNENEMTEPSQTLILTVRNGETKTVECKDIAIGYYSDDEKGQKFLTAVKQIIDIIQATDEWKALPDYEFYYD